MPSVLYGCELWNNISSAERQKLSTFQHFVCKKSLNLPKLTRSDICESLFDVLPITAEVDTRKLLFLGRLCRMDQNTLPKKIFLTRLFSYLQHLSEVQYGFIPDVMDLLESYNLANHISTWLENGFFPDKLSWKRIIRKTVNAYHKDQRLLRMNSPDFLLYKSIFPSAESANIWNTDNIQLSKFICKIYTSYGLTHICLLCGQPFRDVFCHSSCTCRSTSNVRKQWWDTIINTYSVEICAELCGLSELEWYIVLLGGPLSTPMEEADIRSFRLLNFRLVRSASALYYRCLSQ
jgi:hypothetical protein